MYNKNSLKKNKQVFLGTGKEFLMNHKIESKTIADYLYRTKQKTVPHTMCRFINN